MRILKRVRAVAKTAAVRKRHQSAASNWNVKADKFTARLQAQDENTKVLTNQAIQTCIMRGCAVKFS